MNIDEQLEKILANLGVEVERPTTQEDDNTLLAAEVSIFQSSRDHYGVFYRLDLVEGRPQLRVLTPVDAGITKVEIYLACLSTHTPISASLSAIYAYQGSDAFERGREAAEQHLLQAIGEIMKQLFWCGDLENLHFPPEIDVRRLL
jgi:hypothetical protein